MEQYIQISKINDFLYSPRSLYLHSIYEGFNVSLYHEKPQTVGRFNHSNIEKGKYSTAKKFLQGIPVFSEEYNVAGKIDIYDQEKQHLIERKTKIKYIHDGYVYQLYAQRFALEEINYTVRKMFLHSLEDNKRYEVPLPDEKEEKRFRRVIQQMLSFDIARDDYPKSKELCEESIYRDLSY